ncbi:hypothetical protein FACS189452_10300 [Bacteroidia bacterium]|nr:hypothetical protein FACS189452_10300 [Bacteroidia bacterium]GHT81341.1 hypothetical protein FACS189467_5250 [Bacteroidia bacterium]
MTKKKYTTKEAVAAELGANYWALKLLDFFWDYFPEEALDIDFIRSKAADAAAAEEKNALEYGTDPVQQITNRERATEVLYGWYGYALSKHDIICNIIEDYYYDREISEIKPPHNSKWSRKSTRDLAIELLPKLSSIFKKYEETYAMDESFTAEPDYDKMIAELTKKAKKLLDKIEDDASF